MSARITPGTTFNPSEPVKLFAGPNTMAPRPSSARLTMSHQMGNGSRWSNRKVRRPRPQALSSFRTGPKS